MTLSEQLKPLITSNYTYLELHEQIEEHITSPRLKLRVLSSIAWMMDSATITIARSIFEDMRKEVINAGDDLGGDKFADFINAVAEMESSDRNRYEVGFEDNGKFSTLVKLMRLRPIYHDHALVASSGLKLDYTPRSLEELIDGEKVQAVGIDTRVKMQAVAEAFADDDKELEQEMLGMMEKSAVAKRRSWHEYRIKVKAATLQIIALADRRASLDPDDEEPTFYNLPYDLQLRFVRQVIPSARRALVDFCEYSNVDPIEIGLMAKEVRLAQKVFDEIESLPRFHENVTSQMRAMNSGTEAARKEHAASTVE